MDLIYNFLNKLIDPLLLINNYQKEIKYASYTIYRNIAERI
jgi:hypothetical protein